MKAFIRTLVAVALCSVAPWAVPIAGAQTATVQGNWIGTDTNWFNPLNWSNGAVPDENTNVVISGNVVVVIDPALGTDTVHLRNLTLTRHAVLETKAGTKFQARLELVENGARLIHRATEADSGVNGGDLIVTWGAGLQLNPTPKSKREVVLQSTVTVVFGLGGTTPASIGATGPGTYATLTGENVQVGGRLKVQLYYGFTPVDGDRFTIVRSTSPISGSYRGLEEGALVARYGDVGLYLSYGRDGTGQTREHVLFARQFAR